MFSVERSLSMAVTALSLALFAGCKSSQKQAEPSEKQLQTTPAPSAPVAAPSVHPQTNAVKLPPDSGDNLAPNILAWDATVKEYQVQPSDVFAPFSFSLTNVSSSRLLIYDTSSTCDCTVASLPSKPWTLPSGGSGEIHATIDLRKNHGVSVTHDVIVFTSRGNRRLTLKAIVPEPNAK